MTENGKPSPGQAENSAAWLERIFQRQDRVVSRRIAGERLLVPIQGRLVDLQRIFALNPSAELVWQNLNGKQTVAQIVALLADTYSADKQNILDDVVRFLTDCLEYQLIYEFSDDMSG